MKKITLISSAIIIANTVFAQTLQEAITKTDNERFDVAASDYRNLIAKETTKGDNYFYFGENYFKKGDLDSANIFYKKGIELNATYPLNYVGLGKILWYNGQQAEAKTQLFKAATLGANKNAEVMRKTAEIYINAEQKSLDEAINLLNSAIKIEPKNAETYLLMGDAMLEKNPTDGGPAIKNYNKATELNPASPKGDLRSGRLYQRGQNYQLALDLYKKAQATDPTYAPAYREKAELYYKAGQKANAVESYKKYLELNNSLDARERYASFLFSNKQYAEAIGELENLQKAGNTKFYLDRMLGYSYAELGNTIDKEAFNKGLSSINLFFEKTSTVPNFKYVATDYKYKGILLAKTGKDSLGVIEMEKVASMDPTKATEMLREIAKAYYKARKYTKVIETYEKLMDGNPKNLNGTDYFDLGRSYYFGPKDFIKADTCFSRLCQLSPTFATAYFWRAKSNTQQDLKNEKWLAKPHYEAALALVKPEERTTASNKANVIEACEYLGYHALTLKDNLKAKEFFNIIKELDPNNKKQIDFFKSPAGK
jgi:tetratricopeptide (TPR) repeat protein